MLTYQLYALWERAVLPVFLRKPLENATLTFTLHCKETQRGTHTEVSPCCLFVALNELFKPDQHADVCCFFFLCFIIWTWATMDSNNRVERKWWWFMRYVLQIEIILQYSNSDSDKDVCLEEDASPNSTVLRGPSRNLHHLWPEVLRVQLLWSLQHWHGQVTPHLT